MRLLFVCVNGLGSSCKCFRLQCYLIIMAWFWTVILSYLHVWRCQPLLHFPSCQKVEHASFHQPVFSPDPLDFSFLLLIKHVDNGTTLGVSESQKLRHFRGDFICVWQFHHVQFSDIFMWSQIDSQEKGELLILHPPRFYKELRF